MQGMADFITQIGSGVAAIFRLINDGEYDLMKDDLVIPPHLWTSMVFPGSSVTMHARHSGSPPASKKSLSWLRKSTGRGGG